MMTPTRQNKLGKICALEMHLEITAQGYRPVAVFNVRACTRRSVMPVCRFRLNFPNLWGLLPKVHQFMGVSDHHLAQYGIGLGQSLCTAAD